MPEPSPPESSAEVHSRHLIRDTISVLQDRIAAALGVSPADREATVVAILDGSSKAAAGYWLQLLLAMGIASLGLALSSTAVVIGAMLISPLMGPIVAFGMGLAVGSPLLVLRALLRTAMSVVVVVTSSALLMLALPFHEVTAEIAARTSPTALDLLVAVFCALAAAYTTVRAGSDTTATAAGTAIGIALVPPLCVVGYGVGTGSASIASGAALLFTANFCAILLFAVLSFLALGYSAVSISALERAELERHERGPIAALARGLRFVFGLKHSAALRVLMPIALVATVFVPLRAALSQVTWQVRVRAAIQGMLAALPQATVRSSLTVDGAGVSLRLVTLGRAEDAARLERDLREKIAAAAGTVPKVEVIAVPDAAALEQVAAAVRTSLSPPVEVARKEPDLSTLRRTLGGAMDRIWPAEAGSLLTYRVELPRGAPAVVDVVHLGPELGPAGAALLAQDLSHEVGEQIVVRDVAFSAEAVTAEPEAGLTWLGTTLSTIDRLDAAPGLRACLEVPAPSKARPVKDADAVSAVLRGVHARRARSVELRDGPRWKVVLRTGACAEDLDAGSPVDAGAADAAPDGSP